MIKTSFTRLRNMGIFCRVTRLPFCESCLHAEFGSLADNYLGYHAQNTPDSDDEPFEGLFLQHSLDPDSKEIVFYVLSEAGFVVDWPNRSDSKTICLALPHDPRVHWGSVRRHVLARSVFWYWHGLAAHLHGPDGSYGTEAVAEYTAGLPDDAGGPPGLTAAFRGVAFRREIRLDERDVHAVELGHVHLSGQPAQPLQGAALDAVAFCGAQMRLASYSMMGKARDGGPPDTTYVVEAPSGINFSIADVVRLIQPNEKWMARCHRLAGVLGSDVTFAGFVESDMGLVATWA